MTLEQAVAVFVAVAVALVALIGAFMTWRALARAGRALRHVDDRVVAAAQNIPRRASSARERLVDGRAASERALWSLANLDPRLDATALAIAEKRAASDSLRRSMAANRHSLERMRRGARLLLKAVQMRREFPG